MLLTAPANIPVAQASLPVPSVAQASLPVPSVAQTPPSVSPSAQISPLFKKLIKITCSGRACPCYAPRTNRKGGHSATIIKPCFNQKGNDKNFRRGVSPNAPAVTVPTTSASASTGLSASNGPLRCGRISTVLYKGKVAFSATEWSVAGGKKKTKSHCEESATKQSHHVVFTLASEVMRLLHRGLLAMTTFHFSSWGLAGASPAATDDFHYIAIQFPQSIRRRK